MRNLNYILAFIFIPFTCYGQYIKGRVTDSTSGKAIEDVHIYLDNVEEGTQTNGRGTYYLKFSEELTESTKIYFSHISFRSSEVVYDKSKQTYNVALIPKVNTLNEVELTQKRHLKPYLTFQKMKSMSSRLHAFGSDLIDGKIYVVGGNASFQHDGSKRTLQRLENSELSQLSLDQFLRYSYSNFKTDFFKGDLHIYDLKTNSWERRKDLFKKRAHHDIFHFDNKLYAMGGINLSVNKKREYLDATIEILDLDSGEITVDETNPHQAVNFSSYVHGANVFVLGGSTKKNRNGTKNYSNKVHLYKISEGFWYELDTMPTAKETSGLLVKDKLYVIGGYNEKPLTTIEYLDLNSEQWTAIGDLFYGISRPALAAHKHVIYIYNNGKFTTFNTISKELHEYFINISVQNSRMHIWNGSIYLLGGLRITDREIAPSSKIYRIELSTFNTTQIRRSKTLK